MTCPFRLEQSLEKVFFCVLFLPATLSIPFLFSIVEGLSRAFIFSEQVDINAY